MSDLPSDVPKKVWNKKFDRLSARIVDQAGNVVSGLDLGDIGEDGHAVANKLWKISAYLKRR